MKCYKKVLVTDNLYPYSLHSMIKVSAKAWHAILYLVTVTPWQYPPRLGMLFYILSRLGSIRRGLASYSISYHALAASAEACYSISYHALAVSAEAWHAILYLITPWQHPPRLGMLFYILSSRLGRQWQYPPRRGILFYITPWQHPPRLGMLFYIRLGSIRRGMACYSIS